MCTIWMVSKEMLLGTILIIWKSCKQAIAVFQVVAFFFRFVLRPSSQKSTLWVVSPCRQSRWPLVVMRATTRNVWSKMVIRWWRHQESIWNMFWFPTQSRRCHCLTKRWKKCTGKVSLTEFDAEMKRTCVWLFNLHPIVKSAHLIRTSACPPSSQRGLVKWNTIESPFGSRLT